MNSEREREKLQMQVKILAQWEIYQSKAGGEHVVRWFPGNRKTQRPEGGQP